MTSSEVDIRKSAMPKIYSAREIALFEVSVWFYIESANSILLCNGNGKV